MNMGFWWCREEGNPMLDPNIYNQLMAILPLVPHLVAASKSVWKSMIKPLLKAKNYPIPKELEQEMLKKEKNKDVDGIIASIEKLAKSINGINTTQTNTGDNVRQMVINGPVGTYVENLSINPSMEIKHEDLPSIGNEILFAGITGNFPEIKVIENGLGGQYTIHVNNKKWSSATSEKIIEYRSIIKKLIEIGFIEYLRKNTYTITENGLLYAKKLLPY